MMRLTTTEVCEKARFSRATLWRRVRSGDMPKPIDHARQALFCAMAVERALTSMDVQQPSPRAAVLKPAPRRWSADRWKK